jgi:2-haloalkanoic acid dehalogenase type II
MRTMVGIEAVLFDYYGTLAELVPTPAEMLANVAAELGAAMAPAELDARWHELAAYEARPLDGPLPPFRRMVDVWVEQGEALFASLGAKGAGPLVARRYHHACCTYAPFPEAREAVARIARRRRVGIVSDADDDFLRASLDRTRFEVEIVVSSEAVGAYKPHRQMFLTGCERLGVRPEATAYVGDQPLLDVEGARRAGLLGIWLNRDGSTWPNTLAPPGAEISSLDEVEDVLDLVGPARRP